MAGPALHVGGKTGVKISLAGRDYCILPDTGLLGLLVSAEANDDGQMGVVRLLVEWLGIF